MFHASPNAPQLLEQLVEQLRQQNARQFVELQSLKRAQVHQADERDKLVPRTPPDQLQRRSESVNNYGSQRTALPTKQAFEDEKYSNQIERLKTLEAENASLRVAVTKAKTDGLLRALNVRNASLKEFDELQQQKSSKDHSSAQLNSNRSPGLVEGFTSGLEGRGSSSPSKLELNELIIENEKLAFNLTKAERAIESLREVICGKETTILKLEHKVQQLMNSDELNSRMAQASRLDDDSTVKLLSAEIVTLKTEKNILLDRFRNLEEVNCSKDAELKNLRVQNSELEEHNINQRRALDKMTKECQNQDVRLLQWENHLSVVNKHFETRTQTLADEMNREAAIEKGCLLREGENKDRAINQLKSEIDRLVGLVDLRDESEESFRETLKEKNNKISELRNKVIELETQMESTDHEPLINALKMEISNLRALEPEREITLKTVNTLRNEVTKLRDQNLKLREQLIEFESRWQTFSASGIVVSNNNDVLKTNNERVRQLQNKLRSYSVHLPQSTTQSSEQVLTPTSPIDQSVSRSIDSLARGQSPFIHSSKKNIPVRSKASNVFANLLKRNFGAEESVVEIEGMPSRVYVAHFPKGNQKVTLEFEESPLRGEDEVSMAFSCHAFPGDHYIPLVIKFVNQSISVQTESDHPVMRGAEFLTLSQFIDSLVEWTVNTSAV